MRSHRQHLSHRAFTAVVCALALVAACTKNAAKEPSAGPEPGDAYATRSAGERPSDASLAETESMGAEPAPAAPASACSAYAISLANLVSRAELAEEPQDPFVRAKEKWASAPSECRGPAWHLAAARILRWGPGVGPLAAGANSFDTPAAALRAGLALEEQDADLLVFVAFVSALRPETSPPLPDDACARVKRAPKSLGPDYETTDRQSYVCSHAALRTGDHRAALNALESIRMAKRFPDFWLRKAEAYLGLGKKRAATDAAAEAGQVSEIGARAFGATRADVAALRERARELSKRR